MWRPPPAGAGTSTAWPDRSKFYLGLDLDPEQVESLEVVLREGGSNTELARFPMTAAAGFPTGPFGERYTFYAADLDGWADREGHYEVWAELTTSGGLLLTGSTAWAAFPSPETAPAPAAVWRPCAPPGIDG